MRSRKQRLDEATAELTPNRGGDLVEPDDIDLASAVPDAGSHQSSHGTTGRGGDDERGDADDAKVTGQSRG